MNDHILYDSVIHTYPPCHNIILSITIEFPFTVTRKTTALIAHKCERSAELID